MTTTNRGLLPAENTTALKFSNVLAGVYLAVQGFTARDATGASQSRGRGPASARRSGN
jgi:hypothetical protein